MHCSREADRFSGNGFKGIAAVEEETVATTQDESKETAQRIPL